MYICVYTYINIHIYVYLLLWEFSNSHNKTYMCVYTKYVCIYLKRSIIKSYFNGIFMEIMEVFKYIYIYI